MANAKTQSIGPSLSFKAECSKCNDEGFVQIDERTVRICECRERERIERLFRSSRITPAFRCKTFETFNLDGRTELIQKLYRVAKKYSENFEANRTTENNWLSMLGQPGSGKTHLAMAVSNELLKQSIPVLYFQHVEGMSEFKGAFANNESIDEKLEQMKNVAVLYWDDLFKEWDDKRRFEVKIAFEVLNHRYLNLLPTIVTSEKTQQQLVQIDEATGSRIIERSRGSLVAVSGIENNYRLRS